VGPAEREALLAAFDSNWIAPLGPEVDAFEEELAEQAGRRYGAATNSGTAALHLALRLAGVDRGDEVLIPDLTFVAPAAAAAYLGAAPVFVDVDARTWTLDPDLLAAELDSRSRSGRLPGAVVAVDLYGQCADYAQISAACAAYGVPLIEDAAEAVGSNYNGRPAGSFGVASVFSFNGNKIITTSGGGALLCDDEDMAKTARYLSSQARQPVVHYEHTELGYNYRLSNLLAALGRAQLRTLGPKLARRREVNQVYRRALAGRPGIEFLEEAAYGQSNCWLTCLLVHPELAGTDRSELAADLAAHDIEARPVWKPMHLQPIFSGAAMVGGAVSARLFERGLCLPSGSSLTGEQQDEVIAVLERTLARAG
jgi:dTDP-4-amino-4,6-dideoxygalactose transaminase